MTPDTPSRTANARPGRVRTALALGLTPLAILAATGWHASREPAPRDQAREPISQKTDPDSLARSGDAAYQQGRLVEAEDSWRRAVRLDPNRADAWLKLGMLALERGRPGEAVPLLRRAAELDPSSFEPRYNLALSFHRLGRDAEAERSRAIADRLRAASPPKTTMGMLPRSEP